MNRKDLTCHCSHPLPKCWDVLCSRRGGKPTGLVTAEGSCLLYGFCVTDTLSHQQFHKYPTQNWNMHKGGIVGQKYNLKRVCRNPWGNDGWGEGGVGGGDGWVLRCGCQISQPSTKGGFKSFAHPVFDKNKVFCIWSTTATPVELGYYQSEFTCNCVNQTN